MLRINVKKVIWIAAIYLLCIQGINATPLLLNGNDNNKKKTLATTSHGLVAKQSKPNLYIRFFNRVYNKYAKQHAENKQAENNKNETVTPLSHTK